MKKPTKNLRSLLDTQLAFERDARRAVAWGLKNGCITQGSKIDAWRNTVENARRKGWIK